MIVNLDCKVILRWQSLINSNNKKSILIQTHFLKSTRHYCCLSSLRSSPLTPRRPPDGCYSKTHTMLLVETYHQHCRLRALIEKLEKEGSCPMQILGDDGDWTKNDFWAAIKFLRHAFRSNEILQGFMNSLYSQSFAQFNKQPVNLQALQQGQGSQNQKLQFNG